MKAEDIYLSFLKDKPNIFPDFDSFRVVPVVDKVYYLGEDIVCVAIVITKKETFFKFSTLEYCGSSFFSDIELSWKNFLLYYKTTCTEKPRDELFPLLSNLDWGGSKPSPFLIG